MSAYVAGPARHMPDCPRLGERIAIKLASGSWVDVVVTGLDLTETGDIRMLLRGAIDYKLERAVIGSNWKRLH